MALTASAGWPNDVSQFGDEFIRHPVGKVLFVGDIGEVLKRYYCQRADSSFSAAAV